MQVTLLNTASKTHQRTQEAWGGRVTLGRTHTQQCEWTVGIPTCSRHGNARHGHANKANAPRSQLTRLSEDARKQQQGYKSHQKYRYVYIYIYLCIYANINSYRGWFFFSCFAFIFGLENVLQHRVYVRKQTGRVPGTLYTNGQRRRRHANRPCAHTPTCLTGAQRFDVRAHSQMGGVSFHLTFSHISRTQ